jgi:hypothetical protein
MQEVPQKQQAAAAGVAFAKGEGFGIDSIRDGPDPPVAGALADGLGVDGRHGEDAVALAPQALLEALHLERPSLHVSPGGRIPLDLGAAPQRDVTDVDLVQEDSRVG